MIFHKNIKVNRLDKYKVKQVKLDFTNKESWFKIRNRVKDRDCENCKKAHIGIEGDIALATFEDRQNAHVCEPCGKYLISKGAVDITTIQNTNKEIREGLIADIIKYDNRYSDKKPRNWMDTRCLGGKSLDEVKKIHSVLKIEYDKERRIQEEIKNNYVDTPTEQYLIDDWGLFESKEWLKHPEQIEEYFKDVGYEYFECGQGFYQDEAEVYVKIGDKFYNVYITAEIGSAKQDRGDRLYWVENIESVTYDETVKMDPKPRVFTDTEILNCILDNCDQYGFGAPEQWREYIKEQIIRNDK